MEIGQFATRRAALGVVRRAPLQWNWYPGTVALLALVSFMTVAFGLLSTRHPVTGDFSAGIFKRRWLRHGGFAAGVPALIVGGFTCLTVAEFLLFAAMCVFAGTHVERVIGSHRFVVFIGLLVAFRLPLVAMAATVLQQAEPWYACYPTAAWLAVALAIARRFVSYPSRVFQVFGVRLCDQTATDFLALQICLMGHGHWLGTGLCGITACCFAMSDAVGLFRISPSRLPVKLRSLLDPSLRNGGSVVVTFHRPRGAGSQQRGSMAHSQGTQAATTTGGNGGAEQQQQQQEARALAALQDLGFGEDQARVALQRANGNVNRASLMLLDGEIPSAT